MAPQGIGIAQHTSVLAKQQRGWAKQADLGGDGQDIPFEQALSNLAHAYLRDKAPSLLDYEVGFQLLERNQDNTKAIGIVAFKVGSQWIYVPVFFLSGELKGHELLYLKDQDMFVPLKENWLNYILNRKPNVLGDGVDKNTQQLGVLSPDLQSLRRSPTKRASAFPAWVDEFLPTWAHLATTHPASMEKYANQVSLPDVIAREGKPAARFMWEVANRYPVIFKMASAIYGPALADAISAAEKLEKRAESTLTASTRGTSKTSAESVIGAPSSTHPIKRGTLEILTHDVTRQTVLPDGPDEDDQEKLLRDGVLIRDSRKDDEVSVSYNTQVEKKLFNPSETGLYDVLTNAGDVERCFVAMYPMGPSRRGDYVTLVRVEGGGSKDWINVHSSHVWALSKIEGEDYDDWFDDLPVADTLGGRGMFMLCGASGECTAPFRVEGVVGDADGQITYNVSFSSHVDRKKTRFDAGHRKFQEPKWHDEYDRWHEGQRIHLNGKAGSRIVASRGDVFIPEGYRLLKVQKPGDWEKDMPVEPPNAEQRKEPLAPGNIVDAEMAIMSKTSELVIYHDGSEVELNGLRMVPKLAFVSLIKDHGFREKQARVMLSAAERKRKVRYRVKYAEYVKQAQDPFLTPGPNAPGFPAPNMGTADLNNGQVSAQFPSESYQPVSGMQMGSPADYDPTQVPDPMTMQVAQQAASTGQKEIFDTAMIGGLLKSVRQETMIDRYMGDLMKGMDRVGRILFLFYFHRDDFSDRYGKADLPELEDSLRNTFESLGDLVLFLKQKSVDPYPEEGGLGVDLGPTAGM